MPTQLVLPAFRQDWITGCEGHYIILSLKYSNEHVTMFWRQNGYGYSDSLAGAGKFQEYEIRTIFEDTDLSEVALPVPCTRDAFTLLGLYPIVADYKQLPHFMIKQIIQKQE